MANDTKMTYAATATTVISLAADLADGNNTQTTGQTELDNSVLLYPLATATLYSADGFLVTTTVTGTVDLYMIRTAVDGTDGDLPVPSSTTDLESAEYVGSFPTSAMTNGTEYRSTINISLTGVKKALFYIDNNASQTLDYVATPITVKILPFTFGTS